MSESSGLPRGWVEASIDDISDVVRGISFPTNAKHPTPQRGDIACLRTANVQAEVEWDDLWYVPETYVGRDEQFVQEDDILISTANSYELVGKVARVRTVPMRSSLGAFIALMRCREAVTPAFLHHQMYSLEVSTRLRSMASTTTNISNISTGKLRELVLRIAPLPEQHRIVEKIEELFSDLDAGVSALQRAKANLKRYRASVLKSAVEGRLTEEWRTKHPQAEDGQMLLDRILRERREKWEKDQLQKFKEKGKEPPKNWQSKYEEPSAPDTTELPELPEGWVWGTMSLLAERTPHAIGAGPFGTIFKAKDFRPTGIPIIFLRHVKAGEYSTRKPGFMATDVWHRLFKEEYSVFGGELLVTKLGEPPGTACIYPSAIGPAMVTPDVIQMRVRADVADTRFLMHYMNSQIGQAFTSGKAFGTTRPRLTLPLFKELPVFLPPLAEQEQIVALVEERLSQIDSAEKTIDAELIRSKRLRQSILKRAFEGKLVPQNPKDEPASVLLERIKASREAEQPKKKTKKVKAK